MAPKFVDVNEKKQKIIEAALEVITKKGVNNLRIIDVAKRLDIGKSTVYEYFNTKDDLLKQSLEYFLQEMYMTTYSEDITFLEELQYTLKEIDNQSKEELSQFNVMIDIFYRGIKGDFTKLNEVYDDYIKYLDKRIKEDIDNGLIKEDIDSISLARWLVGAIDGIGIQVLLNPSFDYKDTLNSFYKTVENYISK